MRRITAIALATALSLPAPALAQSSAGDLFTNENIGKAVGAIGGALLGSQFGKGSGKLVGVAVGTMAGYFIGGEIGKQLSPRDQQGIAETSQQALETNSTQTWRNPDTGTATTVQVADTRYEAVPLESGGLKQQLWQVPPLDLVNATYASTGNVNVRGGPGTDYVVLDQLRAGERVAVVGRVQASDWVMVARNGIGRGFILGRLLDPVNDGRQGQALAIADGPAAAPVPQAAAAAPATAVPAAAGDVRRCSIITQEVVLQGGQREQRQVKACRQADGTWVTV
jgi:surface antigen